MSTIRDSIEVNVPVHAAYEQWTHFEEFPRFMEGVEEVRKIDDRRAHWRGNIGGKSVEWDSEITEDIPDQRLAWRSVGGPMNRGLVVFEPIAAGSTRVNLEMDYEPEGLLEKAGDALGVTSRRVHTDLEHFKELVENRSGYTGRI